MDNDGSWGCNCNPGYRDNEAGDGCDEINECDDDADICNSKANSKCSNLIGITGGNQGYECICKDGYRAEDDACVMNNDCDSGAVTCDANEHCVDDIEGPGASCYCNTGFEATGVNNTCVDVDECANGSDRCHENAFCTNVVGGDPGYTCECSNQYSGDGFDCYMCPSRECWDYDAEARQCVPKEDCSELTCGPNSMTVGFVDAMFGLEEGDTVSWFGGAVPSGVNGTWSLESAFGENGMQYSYDNVTETVKLFQVFSLVGAERESISRARSDIQQQNNEIALSDGTVETTPFGVSIAFSCVYSTKITLSTDAYAVEDVSISDSLTNSGDWTTGFTMSLDDADLMLGDILNVAISWGATGLVGDLTFVLNECVVSHGSTDISVIKGGCYAGVTNTEAGTENTAGKKSFSFKTFRAPGEDSAGQAIECSLTVCEAGSCNAPSSDDECPSEGNDSFYNYHL